MLEFESIEEPNLEEIFDTEFTGENKSQELKDYEGEDGRPYSEFEKKGKKESVINDEEGNLIIVHNKDITLSDVVKDTDIMNQLMTDYNESLWGEGVFEDAEGDPINARYTDGLHSLRMLPIDNLIFLGDEGNRLRKGDLELMSLQDSVEQLGQLSPIHVIPLGEILSYVKDDNGNDIMELPIYAKYMVIDGVRRVEVFANLGHDYIEAIVDTTIPKELMYFYQTIINEKKELTFREKMDFVKLMRELQPRMAPSILEYSVGFKIGDLPKAEFIDAMQVDFPDIYMKLVKDRITIEQAFKSIDKALTKKAKEEDGEALGLDGQDAEDALRDKQGNDLDTLVRDVKSQELGDRHILDTSIRRTVEARDGSCCQVCGYAKGIPERADNLKVHHMVAVQYGGSDDPDNLILLCNNCHEEVHKYESGRQIYGNDTFNESNDIKRIVVLGNILRKARALGIKAIREQDSSVAQLLDRGGITIGKALQKTGIRINAEEGFVDGSPFKSFKEATKDLDFGGGTRGVLGEIDGDVLGEEIEINPSEVEEQFEDIEIDE